MSVRQSLPLLLLLACANPPAEPPPPTAATAAPAAAMGLPALPPTTACTALKAQVPGPLAAEREKAAGAPLAIARLHVREARLTGDPGFYTLADMALRCALDANPDDLEAQRLEAHVQLQFHRFAAVEATAAALTARPGASWMDFMLLGDALMEQGELDRAADAYQRAMDQRPGLELYDRVAWLRWLWGDVPGALELQQLAVSSGSDLDPEPLAWALTRLGWLHALTGQPAPELDTALGLLPDYRPARFARGRLRLFQGDRAGAAEDLRAAGPTVEAAWALEETGLAGPQDPTVESLKTQDPRGYASYILESDPKQAVSLLEEELAQRHDAVTRIALAAARAHLGQDTRAELQAALATGINEPRALLQAGLILNDLSLMQRAAAMGPGLLPSERARIPEIKP